MAIDLKLRNLLFVIHTVSPEKLRPLVPKALEIDTLETPQGKTGFLATVMLESGAAFPYLMTGFRQVNYRTYVRYGEQAGVLFLRSWVSSRAAAAAMSLAIPTEHAEVNIHIEDDRLPYSKYEVDGRSGGLELHVTAASEPNASFAPFASRQEAVRFLTHRLAGFAVDTRKDGLSIVRVSHEAMDPLAARVLSVRADQWEQFGVLTRTEVESPLIALIQPEIKFEMNLPEKLSPAA